MSRKLHTPQEKDLNIASIEIKTYATSMAATPDTPYHFV